MATFYSGGTTDGRWKAADGKFYNTQAAANAADAAYNRYYSHYFSSTPSSFGYSPQSGSGGSASGSSSSSGSGTGSGSGSKTAVAASASASLVGTPDLTDYNNLRGAGDAAYQNAISTATNEGLVPAQNALAQAQAAYNSPIQEQYQKINKYAEDAWQSARDMDPAIASLYGQGSVLNSYGNSIWGEGTNLYGIGQSLLDGTADPNTIYGAYLNAVRAIDPDRYVSMAASDVQSQADNARAQLARTLGRQGMSANATAAAMQNWAQNLATATSAAKTLARQKGITEKKEALAELNNYATNIEKLAADVQAQAVQAQAQSASAYNSAGTLGAEQSRAFTYAGQMASSAADTLLNGLNAVNNAVGRVVDANQIIANIQSNYGKDLFGLADAAANRATDIAKTNAELQTKVSMANADAATNVSMQNARIAASNSRTKVTWHKSSGSSGSDSSQSSDKEKRIIRLGESGVANTNMNGFVARDQADYQMGKKSAYNKKALLSGTFSHDDIIDKEKEVDEYLDSRAAEDKAITQAKIKAAADATYAKELKKKSQEE